MSPYDQNVQNDPLMTMNSPDKQGFAKHIDKMLEKYPDLMTQEQVSCALGFTIKTLQRWRKKRKHLSFMLKINVFLYNKAEIRDQLMSGIITPKS